MQKEAGGNLTLHQVIHSISEQAMNKPHFTSVALLFVVLLGLGTRTLDAAAPNQGRATAKDIGLALVATPFGLFVRDVSSTPYAGMQIGDRIAAVNGHRVNTEAAFLNHLARSGFTASIMVARNGKLGVLNSPTPSISRPAGGGFINPADLVVTSQGVMHKDVARRLGLSGTPVVGTSLPTHHTGGGTINAFGASNTNRP
jgi:hypothetical protein